MWFVRGRLPLAACLLVACTSLDGAAWAATCYNASQQLPAGVVSSFLSAPSAALTTAPQGGANLVSQVRDLVATDSRTLPAVLDLLNNANDAQKSAIASGLSQAGKICVSTDQDYYTTLQTEIAKRAEQDPAFRVLYASVNGDTGTGAGGAGAGGSPGASGGATSGTTTTGFGTGSVEGINGNGVNTGNFTYSPSVASANNSNASATNPNNPISP